MSRSSIAGRLSIAGTGLILLSAALLFYPALFQAGIVRIGVFLIIALLAVLTFRDIRQLKLLVRTLLAALQSCASGHQWQRLYLEGDPGFVSISEELERTLVGLQKEIKQLESRGRELEAVLASMREGVLLVDENGSIRRLNSAAAAMLGIKSLDVGGRAVEEVLRSPALLRFVRQLMSSEGPGEEEISVYDNSEMKLLVWGCGLPGWQSGESRILVVLNDVTRIRRLEKVRQQFVANVSHELRTPVTAIKGFVETLLDGAIDNPVDCRRFVEIMRRQADRLGLIIDDLLKLSRLEQEGGGIETSPVQVLPFLKSCVEGLKEAAEQKNITLQTEAAESLEASFDPGLMGQAVVNLLENAVTYSDSGGTIQLQAARVGNEIILSVHDSGCGIETRHLEHIFERFYRVDAGRQRNAGGSGLGLAIVKHIAIAHGGYPTVQSIPGNGSVFSLHLPLHEVSAAGD